MSITLQQELSQLTAAEKLLLVEDIWDEIAKEAGIQHLPLPDSQRIELDRRYADFLTNPEEGSSWEDVKRRLLSK